MIAELERLVGVIDAKIEGLPDDGHGGGFDQDAWLLYRRALDAAFSALATEEGGTATARWDGSRLRLAGITATSTSGPLGAMRNWQAAARRRIEKERAVGE